MTRGVPSQIWQIYILHQEKHRRNACHTLIFLDKCFHLRSIPQNMRHTSLSPDMLLLVLGSLTYNVPGPTKTDMGHKACISRPHGPLSPTFVRQLSRKDGIRRAPRTVSIGLPPLTPHHHQTDSSSAFPSIYCPVLLSLCFTTVPSPVFTFCCYSSQMLIFPLLFKFLPIRLFIIIYILSFSVPIYFPQVYVSRLSPSPNIIFPVTFPDV